MTSVDLELTGEATLSRRPERGVVSIEVKEHGEDPSKVAKEVQDTVRSLQALIRPMAAELPDGQAGLPAIIRWSSGAMTTSYTDTTEWIDSHGNLVPDPTRGPGMQAQSYAPTSYKGVEKRNRRTHFAVVRLVLRFTDFAKLGEVIKSLVAWPIVQKTDVSWVLTEETKKSLRGECIKAAYQDAHEKATAFAEAAGLQTVRPVFIKPQGKDARWGHASTGFSFGTSSLHQMQMPANMRKELEMEGFSDEVPQDVTFSSAWAIHFVLE